ncbi:restriction endonuclease [Ramlibacter tataouinensis]|nr:restriction endonuclease [Ramlibacter tataouinensis]
MAPNSLFAILLRSPWWISLAVALAFVAVAHALLPADYRLLGAMGSLPFFVIAAVALVRQLRAPSARQSEATLQAVGRMNWAEFGDTLARGFERQGHAVERLPAGAAADLRLRRDGRTTLVAARRWKAARHGEEALAALHASARREDAGGCVYVTLGELSANARSLAARQSIELMQAPELARLLHGVALPPHA